MRRHTGAAVLLVAAIAATVSFMHIKLLAVQLGQPALAAWLLPLSVDGTVRGLARAAVIGQRSPPGAEDGEADAGVRCRRHEPTARASGR